jgi:predicted nucleic acid-binding protein
VVERAVEAASRVVTSTVAYAEARAAFARKMREGVISEEQHRLIVETLDGEWETYESLSATDAVARRAGDLAERYALRGIDSIHLASALLIDEELREDLRFLAFDDALNAAAHQAVPVYEPESG